MFLMIGICSKKWQFIDTCTTVFEINFKYLFRFAQYLNILENDFQYLFRLYVIWIFWKSVSKYQHWKWNVSHQTPCIPERNITHVWLQSECKFVLTPYIMYPTNEFVEIKVLFLYSCKSFLFEVYYSCLELKYNITMVNLE